MDYTVDIGLEQLPDRAKLKQVIAMVNKQSEIIRQMYPRQGAGVELHQTPDGTIYNSPGGLGEGSGADDGGGTGMRFQ